MCAVVGRQEAENRTVAIRRFGSQEQTVVSLEDAVRMLSEEALAPDQRG